MSQSDQIEALKSTISCALSHLQNIGGIIEVEDEETKQLLVEISQCHDDLKMGAREALGLGDNRTNT